VDALGPRARGVTEADLKDRGARFGSPAIFVSLVEPDSSPSVAFPLWIIFSFVRDQAIQPLR
jgi:hypothetical protein